MADASFKLALMMGGGGALAAYQVGAMSAIAEARPELRTPILCGVSAGAINAVALASRRGAFVERAQALVDAWLALSTDQVFQVDARHVALRAARWLVRLGSGGHGPRPRSLLGTAPLRRFLADRFADDNGRLTGIAGSVQSGELESVAITASSYTTGRSTTWVEARHDVRWDRDDRIGRRAALTVDHVMASAALPMLFPAVRVAGEWCGDGGVLLTSPLSPAVRLGATRVLAISTRFRGPLTSIVDDEGYPPPARVAGMLLNAVFLDQFDADALRLERINELVRALPESQRMGLRPIDLMVLRPSIELAQLANAHEAKLPWALRFMTRGLGTRQTRHNEMLSLLMFQHEFIAELIERGRQDARNRMSEILAFVDGAPLHATAGV